MPTASSASELLAPALGGGTAGLLVGLAIAALLCRLLLSRGAPPGEAPRVSGGLPLFGHALEYARDARAFLLRCHAAHGHAFSARFLFRRIVFVDGSFTPAFFNQSDATLSFKAGVTALTAPSITKLAPSHGWYVASARTGLSPAQCGAEFAGRLAAPFWRSVRRTLPEVLGERGETVTGAAGETTFDRVAWDVTAHFSCLGFFGEALATDDELLQLFVTMHTNVRAPFGGGGGLLVQSTARDHPT